MIPYHSRDTITATYKANSSGLLGNLDSSRALASSRTTYYFGPTYAAKLPWLRAGISAYGVYDRFTDTTLTSLHIEPLGGAVPQSFRGERSQTSEALGITAILGAQVETVEHLWLGAAVALPSVHVTGRTLASDEVSSVTADAATGAAIANSSRGRFDGNAKAQTPLRVNVGVAYDDRKRFSIAADAWWFASRSDAGVIEGTHTFHESRTGETSRTFSRKEKVSSGLASAIDFSLGGEIVLTEMLALRAGAFTDFSNLPKDEPLTLADQYGSRLDRLGATFGLGLTLGSFDTTLGAYYVHGSGTFNALDHTSATAMANGTRVVTTSSTSDTIGIVLSTVVTLDEAKDTMRKNLPVKAPLP